PKRTSLAAPHMSAFGGTADMTVCGCPLSRSLLGAKRTCLFALHMSAFDPKRTSCVGLRRSAAQHSPCSSSSRNSAQPCSNAAQAVVISCGMCINWRGRAAPPAEGRSRHPEDSNAASFKRPHHNVPTLLAQPDRHSAIRERGSDTNRVHVETGVWRVSCGRLCDLARQDPWRPVAAGGHSGDRQSCAQRSRTRCLLCEDHSHHAGNELLG